MTHESFFGVQLLQHRKKSDSCVTFSRHVLLLLASLCWLACGESNPISQSPDQQAPDQQSPGEAARLTADILGHEWTLVAFVTSDGTHEPIIPGSRVTIGFQADGTLGGHGGCNGYGGSWSQSEDGALVVDGIISTLIACEQFGVTEQEQRLFGALQETRRATRTGQALRIDTGTGEYLLFDLVEREQVPPDPSLVSCGNSSYSNKQMAMRSRPSSLFREHI